MIAHAANFIDLGTDFVTSTWAQAGLLFSDLNPILLLVIPVFLAGLVIFLIIRAFHHK